MRSLLLVGCGRMGSALLLGWRDAGLLEDIESITVIDPAHGPERREGRVLYVDSLPESLPVPEMVLLAVKPQAMAQVLPVYVERFGDTPLYLSIAAGVPIDFFTSHLGKQARVIRAMPNSPALVGQGMTVLCASAEVKRKDREAAQALFDAVGAVQWVSHEEEMHAVTALSGSGPAYVFYFVECLVKAGVEAGLSPALAHTLVCQTLAGSVALLGEVSESPAQLREAVTSPGGTTQAALELLEAEGFDAIIERAVAAAAKRSKELAGES